MQSIRCGLLLSMYVCVSVSVCVCVSICLLDTTVSPTKQAEPIEMPFEVWTRFGPLNHVSD